MNEKKLVRTLIKKLAPYILTRLIRRRKSVQYQATALRQAAWYYAVANGVDMDRNMLNYTTNRSIHAVWTIPHSDAMDAVEPRKELFSDTPTTEEARCLKMDPVKVPSLHKQAALKLSQSPMRLDPELFEMFLEIQQAKSVEERLKVLPQRAIDELDRIGHNTVYADHVMIDNPGRFCYPDTGGVLHPVSCKPMRGVWACPEDEPSDLAAHMRYLQREFGIKSEADVEWIANNYVDAVIKHGYSEQAVWQCKSYLRVRETGKTCIPWEKDIGASGLTHIYAMMRTRELIRRAVANSPKYCHPHDDLADALKKCSPAFAKLTRKQLKALAKWIFTPSIYGAGAGGLFNAATGAQRVADLYDEETGAWPDDIGMPPLVEQLLTGTEGEARAKALYDLCRAFSKMFRQVFHKVSVAQEHFRNLYEHCSGGHGLVVPDVHDAELLIPNVGCFGDPREYTAAVYDDDGICVEHSVTLGDWDIDLSGVKALVYLVFRRDSGVLARTIVDTNERDPIIMYGIHDALGYHPRHDARVQRSYRNGMNAEHSYDVMETGRMQVLLPEGSECLRPITSA